MSKEIQRLLEAVKLKSQQMQKFMDAYEYQKDTQAAKLQHLTQQLNEAESQKLACLALIKSLGYSKYVADSDEDQSSVAGGEHGNVRGASKLVSGASLENLH